MSGRTLDIYEYLQPDALAVAIAEKDRVWRSARDKKEQEWVELRNYVFATDTTTTTNASLPWKNKTTRPKLCQIRDNLHANYMAALFPNDNWFRWEARDEAATNKDKSKAIVAYMGSKLRESGFEETVSRLLFDFIDYGNAFADVEYVDERKNINGLQYDGFVGPRLVRISPFDIVFDLTAPSFSSTPKITRTLVSMGDIIKRVGTDPKWAVFGPEMLSKIQANRDHVLSLRNSDHRKFSGFVADGFGSLSDYYSCGMVEILEFEGDLYDKATNSLYPDHYIVVVDRAYVVHQGPIENWFGTSTKRHVGWRFRPDNLMAMGPLDNLVGMQYRIDHLENLKADVFDQIAHPLAKITGYVEEWEYGPGERIYMEQDADVEFVRPDTTALNADFQIDRLESEMEEMAGAPKNAMGIRTPGEKTAFEVQSLDNAAGRIFQSKVSYFEKHFIEPLLNAMLETARRNVDSADLIRVIDDDIGVVEFITITPQVLKSRGRVVPMGARHFAMQNLLVQNLTTLSGTGAYQDPTVSVHFSGFKIAKLLEDNLGLSQYNVVQRNIRVAEQMETQNMTQIAAQELQVNAMTPTDSLEQPGGPTEVEADQTQAPPA